MTDPSLDREAVLAVLGVLRSGLGMENDQACIIANTLVASLGLTVEKADVKGPKFRGPVHIGRIVGPWREW